MVQSFCLPPAAALSRAGIAVLACIALAVGCAREVGAQGSIPNSDPVLLFTIGVHIEPFGTTAQGIPNRGPDYTQPQFFQQHVEELRTLALLVERHGGRMTVQAQSPFTTAAKAFASSILAELAAGGHEIALHFHEDAHLGRDWERLPPEQWCAVLQEEIDLIRQASGVQEITYWSGGNLYPSLYTAAACAGLKVNSDWKNPKTQTTPLALVGVNPWRPSGGTDGVDLTAFLRHDPEGPVIFLPEGQYDREDFATYRNYVDPEVYFQYLATALEASLAASQPNRVNVFHFTVHPGEFRGDPSDPYRVIEDFLTNMVDPLVASGRVRWATYAEMAKAYEQWEQQQNSTPLRSIRRHLRPGVPTQEPQGYITFAINVHDWTHPDESAATLTRLLDLFERYSVRGDFYFTPEITRELAGKYPPVIDRIKHSSHTISYHIRPPHPAYPGFDQRLMGLDPEELYNLLRDYETYGLDLTTGELVREQQGGYLYVASVFGRKPVVASTPNPDPIIKDVGQKLFRDLGARMTVLYHESGTQIDRPFEWVNGLLVRPSDFSITRTTKINGRDEFWWNYMTAPDAYRYKPKAMLEAELAAWRASGANRAPFITVLIHENNFVRRGEGWSWIYYSMNGKRRGDPLPPPWNLAAPDGTQVRPAEEQEAIWQAYEELVAFASQTLQVVTAEDLVAMATTAHAGFDTSKRGQQERNVPYCTIGEVRSTLDLYYPLAGEPWPGAVYIHGGSEEEQTHNSTSQRQNDTTPKPTLPAWQEEVKKK